MTPNDITITLQALEARVAVLGQTADRLEAQGYESAAGTYRAEVVALHGTMKRLAYAPRMERLLLQAWSAIELGDMGATKEGHEPALRQWSHETKHLLSLMADAEDAEKQQPD